MGCLASMKSGDKIRQRTNAVSLTAICDSGEEKEMYFEWNVSKNYLRLNYSSCKSLATLGDRSFHVAAPKLWNDLPNLCITLRKQLRPFYLLRLFKSTFY